MAVQESPEASAGYFPQKQSKNRALTRLNPLSNCTRSPSLSLSRTISLVFLAMTTSQSHCPCGASRTEQICTDNGRRGKERLAKTCVLSEYLNFRMPFPMIQDRAMSTMVQRYLQCTCAPLFVPPGPFIWMIKGPTIRKLSSFEDKYSPCLYIT